MVIGAMLVLTLLLMCILPFVGMSSIGLEVLMDTNSSSLEQKVLWDLRLPRVFLAFLVGAGLSLTGLLFQAFFRNPLASPFTLGISSSAALGAALYFKFSSFFALSGFLGASSTAFVFANLGILLIYFLSRSEYGLSGSGLLLSGVALSFFCSSLVVFLQYVSDIAEIFSITRWLMGSVEAVGFEKVVFLLPSFLMAWIAAFWLSRELDLIAISDEFALTRGVNVSRTRFIILATASLLVGVIVSLCGVIGFVGIMVPHIARRVAGLNHRVLTVCVCLIGGSLVMLCDAISRIIVAPSEIPVGVLTSLIGGPFFFAILLSRRKQRVVTFD